MSGQSFRSAWSDPDHVRLAQFRSWWDAGASDRGPLPAAEDLWQAEPGPQMAPRNLAGGL